MGYVSGNLSSTTQTLHICWISSQTSGGKASIFNGSPLGIEFSWLICSLKVHEHDPSNGSRLSHNMSYPAGRNISRSFCNRL